MLIEHAPAKLNLALEVLGRRPDGYHDLVTIFQTIDLADELTFEPAHELVLECADPALAGPENLVLRAARALREAAGVLAGARIRLTKRIPVAAGLGGGSADAAAALRGLASLWRLGGTDLDLPGLARRLGADVPFLLRGGTALAEGIGDRIEWLPDAPTSWVVLHTPEAAPPDKTVRAYRALGPADWSDGSRTRAIAAALRAGRAPDLANAPNAFARAADTFFPSLTAARARFRAAGAPWVRLTGAGPTLFTLVEARDVAAAIAARLDEATTWYGMTLPLRLVDRTRALQ